MASKTATDWADGREAPASAGAEGEDVGDFLHRHQEELLHFFHGRLQQPQDAADLAQESCMRLLRYPQVNRHAERRPLLFRIARNLLNDHWRWHRVHSAEEPTDLDELHALDSGEPSQERRLDGMQRLRRLEATIESLPPKCRSVFLLSRMEGLSNLQVAQRCGVSVKMVEKHLARALAECRRQVGDREP